MMAMGDWVEFLSWNLRVAASLWYAWGGGMRTVLDGRVRLCAAVLVADGDSLAPGTEIEFEPIDEAKPKKATLTLVP